MKSSFSNAWSEVWNDRSFRRQFVLTIPGLVLLLGAFARFLDFVEDRPGAMLADPLLHLFPPVNLTWLTFLLIYGSIVGGLAALTRAPRMFVLALQTYMTMVVVRVVMMYVTPLEHPEAAIPLVDPFVQLAGTGRTLMKDLFFSGHTATLCILFLTAVDRPLRIIFLCNTILVATAVLLQHGHYTVDVLVAPFIAFCSFRLVVRMHTGWINPRKGT